MIEKDVIERFAGPARSQCSFLSWNTWMRSIVRDASVARSVAVIGLRRSKENVSLRLIPSTDGSHLFAHPAAVTDTITARTHERTDFICRLET